MRKVLIAVSGTGGHVYPGIAVAEELRARRRDVRVLFATARGKPGVEWIGSAGFEVAQVPLRGFARRPGLSWFAFPFTLVVGGLAALALLVAEGPDLVIGTGGYVSGPFVAFASLLRIPTIVLEQNSIPGVSTRLASLVAREVHVAFPESVDRLFRKGRAAVTGNPVRRSVEEGDAARFRAVHGLPAGRPVLLVLGGSQGARSLTEAAIGATRLLGAGTDLGMVLQSGEREYESARRLAADLPPDRIRVVPFLDDVGDAYAAADLIVARAGAMTLAELAAAGTAALLVPYPHAAEDHQRVNARRYAASGAARVLDPEELDARRLADEIERMIGEPGALDRMAEAARREGEEGARERIATACERYLA